jgi:hypothetical protein
MSRKERKGGIDALERRATRREGPTSVGDIFNIYDRWVSDAFIDEVCLGGQDFV